MSIEGPDRDIIEGEFLVGQVRYVYYKPYFAGDGVNVDEHIVTSVLNCKEHYFGTIKQVTKLKGKITSEEITPAYKMLMIQLRDRNTGTLLCDLHSRSTQKKKE